MASSLPECAKAFILVILCANPILKGAFTTLLNGMILQLSQEIDILTLQIARLNVLNSLTSLGVHTLRAIMNKVSSDLNLFLGPFQTFSECGVMQDLNSTVQNSAVGKKFSSLNKKLYNLNRVTNLVNVQNAIKQNKEKRIEDLQQMLLEISSLCS